MAQTSAVWRPTREQQALLDTALESGIGRTITAVCEESGVPRRTYYNWMQDPDFARAWEDAWYGTVRRHLPGAIQALSQRALEGDVPAIKLLTELAGVYRDRREVTGDGLTIVIGDHKERSD